MVEIKYRPELDGLRAIAVILVVLCHAGLGMSGGYVGVDVFFVLSGFLLTGILLQEMENNTFSLAGFWERRIRRLFPALFVTVAATLSMGYWLLLPSELDQLGQSAIAQVALLANVYFWQDTGYFAGTNETKPLLHTWSLAVEEQFYLLLPLLLVKLRHRSRGQLFWLLTVLSTLSFVNSLYATHITPTTAFFLLPPRAWELLVGCLLALRISPVVSRPGFDGVLGLLGLAAILLPACLYDDKTLFPGLAAVAPVAGTAAIVYATAATPGTIVERLLSARPVVFVGLLSYSIYLWHWPVIVYVRYYFAQVHSQQIVLIIIVTLICAALSWKFVEQPFRQKYLLKRRERLVMTSAALSATIASVGLVLMLTDGLPKRFPPNFRILIEDVEWRGLEYSLPKSEAFQIGDAPRIGRVSHIPDTKLDFLIWGDSHSLVLCKALDESSDILGLEGRVVSYGGQVPGPGVIYKHNRPGLNSSIMEWMSVHKPRNLVIINRWSCRVIGVSELERATLPQLQELYLSDDVHESKSFEESEVVLLRILQRLAEFCDQNGIRLWILKQVPETNEGNVARDFCSWQLGRTNAPPTRSGTREQHRIRQSRPTQVFAKIQSHSLQIIDPAPLLFDADGLTINFRDGRACYRDDNHLTRWGAEFLKPLFIDMFTKMRREKEHPKQPRG